MAEKFNLTWHKYPSHAQNMLSELNESAKYSDVTLVCADKSHFKAHNA